MTSPLNLSRFSLITLVCDENDVRVNMNNNMDVLFSFNKINKEKGDTLKKLTVETFKTEHFKILDLFVSKNSKIDFLNYYQKSLKFLAKSEKENKFIPFERYEEHEEYKTKLTMKNGTNRNYFDKTLDFRIEGKLTPQIAGGFVFEDYFQRTKESLLNFESKKHRIYPNPTTVVERKLIY